MNSHRLAPALVLSVFAACGSETPPTAADGGQADAAPPADAGVRALCPMLEAPACDRSMACGASQPAPNDCAGCRPRFEKPCNFGACETLTNPVTIVNVFADITQVRGAIRSFVITGLSAETAGGLPLTCMDLTKATDPVSIDEPCVTVLDSRTYNLGELNPTGEIYPVILSNFPTSAPAVILVQAFDGMRGNGTLIGHTCVDMAADMPATNDRINLDGRSIVRL